MGTTYSVFKTGNLRVTISYQDLEHRLITVSLRHETQGPEDAGQTLALWDVGEDYAVMRIGEDVKHTHGSEGEVRGFKYEEEPRA